MNPYAWEEAKIASLLYLNDNHNIFECIFPNDEQGELKFSDYKPWACNKKVLNHFCNHGYVVKSRFVVANKEYIKYTISGHGRYVFHLGQDL
ncbi:hypothetical protein ACE41O_16525 [Alteromonas macleodii]|jgi:hypothetical protein|uniref:hypothetical protein n=1 Tax=Alteromonas macleodii TaxID=28108 RepID=UPI002FE0EF11|tara:strand:- start:5050 stop:5325 length:276 start_codon:yes stop_codon:yes gene_type:complete